MLDDLLDSAMKKLTGQKKQKRYGSGPTSGYGNSHGGPVPDQRSTGGIRNMLTDLFDEDNQRRTSGGYGQTPGAGQPFGSSQPHWGDDSSDDRSKGAKRRGGSWDD